MSVMSCHQHTQACHIGGGTETIAATVLLLHNFYKSKVKPIHKQSVYGDNMERRTV